MVKEFKEKKKVKTIIITMKMADPKGQLIPRGIMELLKIQITDGAAVFQFRDRKVTKKFANISMEADKKKGKKRTLYLERAGKAITQYPDKTKEEIRDIVLNDLRRLKENAKSS